MICLNNTSSPAFLRNGRCLHLHRPIYHPQFWMWWWCYESAWIVDVKIKIQKCGVPNEDSDDKKIPEQVESLKRANCKEHLVSYPSRHPYAFRGRPFPGIHAVYMLAMGQQRSSSKNLRQKKVKLLPHWPKDDDVEPMSEVSTRGIGLIAL